MDKNSRLPPFGGLFLLNLVCKINKNQNIAYVGLQCVIPKLCKLRRKLQLPQRETGLYRHLVVNLRM